MANNKNKELTKLINCVESAGYQVDSIKIVPKGGIHLDPDRCRVYITASPLIGVEAGEGEAKPPQKNGNRRVFMKLFGVSVSRDYEEAKNQRREALANKENIEYLVEHGSMGILQRKFIWRLDDGRYPRYCWLLHKLLYSAMRILFYRFINSLSRPNGRLLRQK